MHHSRISSANDILVFQDSKLRFEATDGVNWFIRTREHESRRDILIVDTAQTDADVVATHRRVDLLFHFVVHGGDFDGFPVRHEDEVVAFADVPGFDFAHDDGAHVFVFLGDGHHEGGVDLAIYHGHSIHVFEEGRSTGRRLD